METENPLSRRESKKRSTRENLLHAALTLIREQGYEAVTVANITEAAGTAKGTFFNYFDSKADVLAAWYETASRPPDGVKFRSLKEALDLAVYKPLDALTAEPELLAAKIAHENENASVARAEAEFDQRLIDILTTALIKEEKQTGPLPVSASDLASLIVAILTGAAREWRIKGGKQRLSALARRRMKTLFALIDRTN